MGEVLKGKPEAAPTLPNGMVPPTPEPEPLPTVITVPTSPDAPLNLPASMIPVPIMDGPTEPEVMD